MNGIIYLHSKARKLHFEFNSHLIGWYTAVLYKKAFLARALTSPHRPRSAWSRLFHQSDKVKLSLAHCCSSIINKTALWGRAHSPCVSFQQLYSVSAAAAPRFYLGRHTSRCGGRLCNISSVSINSILVHLITVLRDGASLDLLSVSHFGFYKRLLCVLLPFVD